MDGTVSETEPVESDVLDKDVKDTVDTLSQSPVTDVGAGPTAEHSENGNAISIGIGENGNEVTESDNSSPQREGSLSRFLKGAKEKFDALPPEWGQRRTS